MAIVIRDPDILDRIKKIGEERKHKTSTKTAKQLLVERLIQLEIDSKTRVSQQS